MKHKKEKEEVREEVKEEVGEEGKKIESLEAEPNDFKDKYLRAHAELDNFRKRMVKERSDLLRYRHEDLLKDLVIVRDHFERAIEHAGESTTVKDFRDGIDLILKELAKVMEKFGVTEIAAAGKPFDPSIHEAIQHEPSEDYEPGIVAKEFQKGYIYHDRLLRPASVSVSAEAQEKTQEKK